MTEIIRLRTLPVGGSNYEKNDNDEDLFTFFEAAHKPGTATNYIYSEIRSITKNLHSNAVGELKFFAGLLLSWAVASAALGVIFAPSKFSQLKTAMLVDPLSLTCIFLFLVLALLIRAAIITITLPSRLKFYEYLVFNCGGIDGEHKRLYRAPDQYWSLKLDDMLEKVHRMAKRECRIRLFILFVFIGLVVYLVISMCELQSILTR